jgi:HTH-type transcriptional regulator, sugar sensing transcriptional regulator
MIANGEFLSRLRKIFDLNLYEVKVWTSLLSRGISTAGELSTISDVPRSRTYDILESLEKKGFVVMKIGKPIQFIALKPEEVVDRVKRNMISNAQEKAKRLEQMKKSDMLTELSNLYDNGIKYIEPVDLSGSVKGRQNVYNHLDMMLKNSKKSAMIITTAEGLDRKFESLKESIEKAKKRGVDVKIAAPINSSNYKTALELSKFAEVMALDEPRGRFAIIDDKQMMLILLDDKTVHPSYDIGIWLSSEFFAKSMSDILHNSWKGFTPLKKLKL